MKPFVISFIAILLLGCGSNANTNNTGFKMADSARNIDTATHQSPNNITNPTPTQNTPPPNSDNTANPTNSVSADLPSIISGSTIKFDENFTPIATITLHNTTGKEIDQILFRFTFTEHRLSDGPIDLVAASDYSSYVNLSVYLKPPDTATVEVKIPEPRMKAFDTPNVFITKIRYYDGTVATDDR